jgi:hypothetical protein
MEYDQALFPLRAATLQKKLPYIKSRLMRHNYILTATFVLSDSNVLINTTTAAETLPLALVISVPLVSLTLLSLLLISAFCLKRAVPGAMTIDSRINEQKKKSVEPGSAIAPLPNVVLNPMGGQPSPYATSQLIADTVSGGMNSLSSYKQYHMLGNPNSSPFRTASVQQKQWRPLLHQAEAVGGDASSAYMEVSGLPMTTNEDQYDDEGVRGDKDGLVGQAEDGDDEEWVEVSNQGNQTPNHWVYSDMIR